MKRIKEARQIQEVISEILKTCKDGECSECALFKIHSNGAEICSKLQQISTSITNKLDRTLEQFQRDEQNKLKKPAFTPIYRGANAPVEQAIPVEDAQQNVFNHFYQVYHEQEANRQMIERFRRDMQGANPVVRGDNNNQNNNG